MEKEKRGGGGREREIPEVKVNERFPFESDHEMSTTMTFSAQSHVGLQ